MEDPGRKEQPNSINDTTGERKEEAPPAEVEPNTGVSFPIKLKDGKQLNAVGLRKEKLLGMPIKVYAFGIYMDNEKLKDLLRTIIGKAPEKPTEDIYRLVIDSDVAMMIRSIFVFSGLNMSMIRMNFSEGLGTSIKKLTGVKNTVLAKMVMGGASNDVKITSGSVIEISRLPGYTLQTIVNNEVISTVESELLCRAFINMYLGDDPFDKEAKEKFGMSLLSLF